MARSQRLKLGVEVVVEFELYNFHTRNCFAFIAEYSALCLCFLRVENFGGARNGA